MRNRTHSRELAGLRTIANDALSHVSGGDVPFDGGDPGGPFGGDSDAIRFLGGFYDAYQSGFGAGGEYPIGNDGINLWNPSPWSEWVGAP
ncbi:MAG TPA: hypothetical protein VKN99_23405 [Polyangia bacterium]|nr:hypothetical protein [Polyangia bacterium]